MRIRVSPVVLALGAAQNLAWASSFYLVAIVADPIAKDLRMSPTSVFAAFSTALLVSALLGPFVGRTIDRIGGRSVLIVSNICFAAGLGLLAISTSWQLVWLSWLCLGAGMALGLYDAAFATLARIFGRDSRASITGVTLIGGFASTVGWPLTAWGCATLGWHQTCLAWAMAHIFIGIPLNASLPRTVIHAHAPPREKKPNMPMDRNMWLLAFAFAAGWTISTAMAAHLPRLLQAAGATEVQAVTAGILIGPAQVAARIIELSFLKRFHPLVSAKLSMALHPIGVGFLSLGAWAVPVFVLLHGAGNGILTIARGTVPLAIYGPVNYGYRLGILGAPARMAQAAAPLLFGVLIQQLGEASLAISAGLGLAALAAFSLVDTQEQLQKNLAV